MTTQKVFRYRWRINAILILVAAGAVTFGVGALLVGQFGASSARTREAESGPLATGGYAETRNVLFIDPGEKNARWLLPDDKNIIVNRRSPHAISSHPFEDRTQDLQGDEKAPAVDEAVGTQSASGDETVGRSQTVPGAGRTHPRVGEGAGGRLS